MRIFESYPWPGNIRQLKNVVERAVVLAKKDRITIKELPEEFLLSSHVKTNAPARQACSGTLREMELEAITKTLRECKGNKSKAAKLLGISRKAFYKRLKEAQLA